MMDDEAAAIAIRVFSHIHFCRVNISEHRELRRLLVHKVYADVHESKLTQVLSQMPHATRQHMIHDYINHMIDDMIILVGTIFIFIVIMLVVVVIINIVR